jgi:hypothetical protein
MNKKKEKLNPESELVEDAIWSINWLLDYWVCQRTFKKEVPR